jgi:hypothetical protein
MSALEVLTIPSNLIYFVAAGVAFYIGHATRPFLYLGSGLASTLYHMCAFSVALCVLPAVLLRGLDFFFAQSLIGSSALLIIIWPEKFRKLEHLTLFAWFFAVLILIIFLGTSLYIQIGLAGVGFVIIITYWSVYAYLYQEFPPYNLDMLFLGISLTVLACSLFTMQMMYPGYYGAIHQIWHITGGLGQIALLLCKDPPKDSAYALIDKQLK